MISLIYLASALILGLAVTRYTAVKLMIFERLAMSTALGLLLWTWLSFGLCLVMPITSGLAATVLISLASSLLLWKRSPSWKTKPLPGGNAAWYAWGIFSLLSTGLIGILMWTHDLISRPDGLYSANATWADFGQHASLISHFAEQNSLTLDFPVAAGAHLTYPFMTDMLSGWLLRGNLSLHDAIWLPSILLIAAFIQLMIGFGVRLFGRIGGMLAGLSLSLLCGPAAGLAVAWNDFQKAGVGVSAFIAQLPQDYTALNQPNAQITNLIADAILPQRAFLMGFSTFGAVMVFLTILHKRRNFPLAAFTGVLIGLLPLVHAHTFIVLYALVLGLWIEASLVTKNIKHNWTLVGIITTIIALPQIAWQLIGNGTGSGGHVSLLWNLLPGEDPWQFISNNYGLTGLLIVTIAVAVLLIPGARRYRAWYLPFAGVFLFANIYSLQTFSYDNVKLIYYVYLMTYIFAGYTAVSLFRRHHYLIIPIALIGVFLSGSGILSVAREFQHADQFASFDDIALAQWIRASTRPTDVFATTDRPNQPVSALGGRPVISGYRGWLYSYHLDYVSRLAAIQTALLGQLPRSNSYSAKYVAVSQYEPPEWSVNRDGLESSYKTVYSNQSWTVYEIPDR